MLTTFFNLVSRWRVNYWRLSSKKLLRLSTNFSFSLILSGSWGSEPIFLYNLTTLLSLNRFFKILTFFCKTVWCFIIIACFSLNVSLMTNIVYVVFKKFYLDKQAKAVESCWFFFGNDKLISNWSFYKLKTSQSICDMNMFGFNLLRNLPTNKKRSKWLAVSRWNDPSPSFHILTDVTTAITVIISCFFFYLDLCWINRKNRK